MAKVAFSRSDVIAINDRMAGESSVQNSMTFLRSPTSPVAAKVMREIGVSSKKIAEAYRFARLAANQAK